MVFVVGLFRELLLSFRGNTQEINIVARRPENRRLQKWASRPISVKRNPWKRAQVLLNNQNAGFTKRPTTHTDDDDETMMIMDVGVGNVCRIP